MSGDVPVSTEATFASRTSTYDYPPEVAAVVAAIASRLSWASVHWGTERVHPDAWPHIAATALDAVRAMNQEARDADQPVPVSTGLDLDAIRGRTEAMEAVLRDVADMWTGREAFMPVAVIEAARRALEAVPEVSEQ